MGIVLWYQCDITKVQYILFREDIVHLPYPIKHQISVEQSQKEHVYLQMNFYDDFFIS